jgi:Zn ribbon nucleic-acid-binding protein
MKSENQGLGAEKGLERIQQLCLKERSIQCICPKCGARHRLKMLWTGRGVPRKFCPICKHYSSSISDVEPCKIAPLPA